MTWPCSCNGLLCTTRSARLLLAHAGLQRDVSIRITKQIPVAAGLGGGSSDAAAVLLALDELLALDLPRAELLQLGMQLGADVPFFLYGQTAWATGVGDRLRPWPGLPPLWLVLVNPGIAVSTASVFRNLRLTHPGPIAKLPGFPAETSALVRLLHNDLEAVTCQKYPVITTIKEQLVASGARGALMSGSGSTVFGLFDDRNSAAGAAGQLAENTGWWVRVVTPV
ncbi:MAG: 4-(cytidine 5'-diphospho)-2-C-methyl-D-erythritol kinase [Desulfuromonadales bacterium]